MTTGGYWSTLERQRMSRRRVLGAGLAAGVGAAGITLVGCGSGKKKPAGEAATTTPSTGQSAAVGTRGGIYRSYTFDALTLDTMDPHQTQFGPIYNMHSAVFSKVLQYDDEITQTMSPDLADGKPETPDKLTYLIKLRKGAKFHDNDRARQNFPQVAGRELTAEDVKYSIERQIAANSPQAALYYRSGQWKTIDHMEIVDTYTLKITTKRPTAPFLHYLADRNAYVVAKEVVDSNDTMNSDKAMIGTGPFFLDDFRSVEVVKARRNPSWFARDDNPKGIGMNRPFLDGYDSLWTPQSNSAEEAAIRSKQVDSTGFEDDSTAIRVTSGNPNFVLYEPGVSGWVNSRLWLSEKSPLRDFRLRKAIHLAIDRKTLSEQMFPAASGFRSYLEVGPITYPMTLWAIPQDELEKRPGYRSDSAGREQDVADAKKLWETAAGPDSLKAIFAGVPTYLVQKGLPELKRQLKETLNLTLQEEVDATGYTTLAECYLRNAANADEGTCPMSFGFDNGWIDLDDWLYPYFHTGGTKNSFRLSDPELDSMLDAQREEFDQDKRRKLGLDIQAYLLDNVLARLDYSAPVGRFADWSYVKNEVVTTWFGSNFKYANTWLDQTDPSYAGRA